MSISNSKSKIQLAYARTSKVTPKPKLKNQSSASDLNNTKGTNKSKNSNIYESIMGQIDSTQQDYIKSLIVKNQKQATKQSKKEDQTIIQKSKDIQKSKIQNLKQKDKPNNNSIVKKTPNKKLQVKQTQESKNIQSMKKISYVNHERTRSQAQMFKQLITVNQPNQQLQNKNIEHQQKNIINKNEQQNQTIDKINQNKSNDQSKILIQTKIANNNVKTCPVSPINKNIPKKEQNLIINPIIEALNNSSSSFAKKLQNFQLQYPNPTNKQRQQRSTHKKTGSKILNNSINLNQINNNIESNQHYFSYQTSPKNNLIKKMYTKQIKITKKHDYQSNSTKSNQKDYSQSVSPVNNNNNYMSNQCKKQNKKPSTNFLQCLDQYLEALNLSQNVQNNNFEQQLKNNNNQMKKNVNNKIKQYHTNLIKIGQVNENQNQQQQTVVLRQKNNKLNNNHNNPSTTQTMIFSSMVTPNNQIQHQKLLKTLQKQSKKVQQLMQTLQMYKKQLNRYKKKEKKMKQNQYHMIQCLKSLNQQLTQQKKEKRKLQNVVKQFQNKIKNITGTNNKISSKSKNKYKQIPDRYSTNMAIYQQQRPQRKTIYGNGSNIIQYQMPFSRSTHTNVSSNFHYNNDKSTPIREHMKRNSLNKNRYSSTIIHDNMDEYMANNNINTNINANNKSNYQFIANDYDNCIDMSRLNKNRTQKINKIISSFQLNQNQQYDNDYQQDNKYHINIKKNKINSSLNVNNNKHKTNIKNTSIHHQLINNSNKIHQQLISKTPYSSKKSQPHTPKIIQDLFRQNKKKNDNKLNMNKSMKYKNNINQPNFNTKMNNNNKKNKHTHYKSQNEQYDNQCIQDQQNQKYMNMKKRKRFNQNYIQYMKQKQQQQQYSSSASQQYDQNQLENHQYSQRQQRRYSHRVIANQSSDYDQEQEQQQQHNNNYIHNQSEEYQQEQSEISSSMEISYVNNQIQENQKYNNQYMNVINNNNMYKYKNINKVVRMR